MKVSKDAVVTFEFTVVDDHGQLVESSRDTEPMCYLHGAGRIAPGLESAMEGRSVSDTFSVMLSPKNGFGERDESRVHVFSREELAGLGELRIGMQLKAEDDSGNRVLTVSRIEDETITLDENHPLAGKVVSFDITVIDIRRATAEELGQEPDHDVRCTDDCGTCGLHDPLLDNHDCGCGCDHH